MKRLWLFVLAGCLAVALSVVAHPVAAADVRAGVAEATFTLPPHVPLAGYSRRKGKPSTGQHDPVGVRALVLQDDHTAAALVSCDLLIVDEQLFEAVRQRIIARGLPPNIVLILAATHTHSGPGAYGTRLAEKISMGHYDPRVFQLLVDTIAHAIVGAATGLTPVTFGCRAGTGEGLVKNRVEERGFADTEVPTCAFYRVNERTPMAVIVSFAAHPTTLNARNRELSADYPGVVRREVERRFPTAVCLFFAGAVGDQAPAKLGNGFDRAERIGLPLAQQASTMIEATTPTAPAGLRALQERMPLPPARVRLNRWLALPHWISQRLVEDDATLSIVTVGQTVWFGVPCDVASTLGRDLKSAARTRGLYPVVVGFASDYVGYCMPESVYNSGDYEALMAFNGPTTGRLIVQRLIQMLDAVTVDGAYASPVQQSERNETTKRH